ncbi:YozE family protein [Streptomyces sp. NPDC048350]|uniref:YozE family protein n=1 Tax=Streptomyces sp. NPDC048350 TaxID=3365538 RepID=UPI0037215E6E
MSNESFDFRAWLLRHVDEQSAAGDLARDVRVDDQWPEGEPESLDLYSEHLEYMGASRAALEALEVAWGRYAETGVQA